jgi:hypothetical protein
MKGVLAVSCCSPECFRYWDLKEAVNVQARYGVFISRLPGRAERVSLKRAISAGNRIAFRVSVGSS